MNRRFTLNAGHFIGSSPPATFSDFVTLVSSRTNMAEWPLAAAVEGYAFQANHDCDPAVGGLASPSRAGIMRDALRDDHSRQAFSAVIEDHPVRRLSGVGAQARGQDFNISARVGRPLEPQSKR